MNTPLSMVITFQSCLDLINPNRYSVVKLFGLSNGAPKALSQIKADNAPIARLTPNNTV